MRPIILFLAVVTLGTTTAGTAEAQHAREGFWFSGGLGAGAVGGDDIDANIGAAALLSFGGSLSPTWKLGFESSGFATRDDGVYRLGTTHAPTVYFFPSDRGGLFLKGGIGYLQYLEAVDDDELDEDVGLSGWGVQLGVGYDLRVGSAVSLTPYLMGMMIGSNEIELDGVGTGIETNARLGQLGVAITVR